ncbi:MAG: HupE/UreJ family protein [Methylococcaceae bacterium]
MKKIIVVAGLIAFSQAASAHTGLLPTNGFSHGFQHPFLGLDHFLAMLGLGLWASSQSRRLAKQAIGLFLLFMTAWALLGLAGFGFAYVETAILVSLVSVGIALSFGTAKLPKTVILASIAAFASMHGLAHGSEMPVAASAYAYIAGIVSGTAVLHFSGLALGLIARRVNAIGLIRVYGTLTGMIGAWLLFAA